MEAHFKVAIGLFILSVTVLSLSLLALSYEQQQTNECRIEASKTHSVEDAKNLCR